ncbi:MAG TPA: DNA-binding protein [Candidatus Paceibacterota bacterium]|nr:DNA-binding protein [Candidatus Paceibacterota bacterium]
MNITKLFTPTLLTLLLATNAAAGTNTLEDATKAPIAGKVLETTNSGGYTYILVQHGAGKTWTASQQFNVAIGDSVNIPTGWVMKDFKSTTLNRMFDWILFAPGVEVNGKPNQPSVSELPPGHPPTGATPAAPATKPPIEVKKGSVAKAQGGYTVEECYAKKSKLSGKTVKVRGVVVKFTPEILGRNWIHLRDGSGKNESGDLTVTTQDEVKVGDTIVVEGKVACDKDFGAGYKYSLLIEDATAKK